MDDIKEISSGSDSESESSNASDEEEIIESDDADLSNEDDIDDAEELEENEIIENDIEPTGDGDETLTFEDKKKKTTKHRKFKLFPFLKKSKKRVYEEPEPYIYQELNTKQLRKEATEFLDELFVNDPSSLEENIYRYCNENKKILTAHTKTLYIKTLHWIMGSIQTVRESKTYTKESIPEELDKKQIFWNSSLFKDIREEEKNAINNILTPVKIEESGEYKCKQCGSRRIMRVTLQLRRGDEPPTHLLKCFNDKKRCGYSWKVNS